MFNRIKDVYLRLGRVTNHPASFGLGPHAPQALLDELAALRLSLKQELEQRERVPDEDQLTIELSQDTDRPVPANRRKTA